jgi:alanyl-tRNA synthetase
VEESVSAGTRRIEALTGIRAEAHRRQVREILAQIADRLGCKPGQALAATEQLVSEIRAIKKDLSAGKPGEHADKFVVAVAGSPIDPDNYHELRQAVRDITRRLNVSAEDTPDRIDSLLAERAKLMGELTDMSAGENVSVDDLIRGGERVGDALLVVADVAGGNPNVMRGWIDQIRKKHDGRTAVLLATVQAEKVLLIGGLSKSLVDQGLKAGEWVGAAARAVGGGGGGRPDMAQAGGKEPSKLPQALAEAKETMREQLK